MPSLVGGDLETNPMDPKPQSVKVFVPGTSGDSSAAASCTVTASEIAIGMKKHSLQQVVS